MNDPRINQLKLIMGFLLITLNLLIQPISISNSMLQIGSLQNENIADQMSDGKPVLDGLTKFTDQLSNLKSMKDYKINTSNFLDTNITQSNDIGINKNGPKTNRTKLEIFSAVTEWRKTVELKAKLTYEDINSSPPEFPFALENATVDFYIQIPDDDAGDEYKAWVYVGSAQTDSFGFAILNFYADIPAKRYFTRAEFTGNYDYAKSKSFVNHKGLIVHPAISKTFIADIADVNITDTTLFESTILDRDDNPVGNGSIIYQIRNSTNIFFEKEVPFDSGISKYNYRANLAPGIYEVRAIFPGNENLTYSVSSTGMIINREDTQLLPNGILVVNPVVTQYSKTETFLVRLTDNEGNPLENQPLNLSIIDSQNIIVYQSQIQTNTNGFASDTIEIKFQPNMYNIEISYSNETYFVSQFLQRAFEVQKTALDVVSMSTHLQYSDAFEMSFQVANLFGNPIDNATVVVETTWFNTTHSFPFRQYILNTDNLGYISIQDLSIQLEGSLKYNITVIETDNWFKFTNQFNQSIALETVTLSLSNSLIQTVYGGRTYLEGQLQEDLNSTPPATALIAQYSNGTGNYIIGSGQSSSNGSFTIEINANFAIPNDTVSYPIVLSTLEGFGYQRADIPAYVYIQNVIRIASTTKSIEVPWKNDLYFDLKVTDFFGTNQTGGNIETLIKLNDTSGAYLSLDNTTITNGIAPINFTIPEQLVPDYYQLSFVATHPNFTGNIQSSIGLNITKLDTLLKIPNNIQAYWGDGFELTANLTYLDALSDPINNTAVYFQLYNSSLDKWMNLDNSKSNVLGIASSDYSGINPFTGRPLDARDNPYLYRVMVNETIIHRSTMITGNLTIIPIPVDFEVEYLTPRYNDGTLNVKILVRDFRSQPLDQIAVRYNFPSLIVPIFTPYSNQNGIIDISLSLLSNGGSGAHLDTGNYTLFLDFLGIQGKYSPISSNHTITVAPDLADVRYDLTVSNDEVLFTFTTDDPNPDDRKPIENLPVDFSIQLRNWITQLNDLAIAQKIPDFADSIVSGYQPILIQNSLSISHRLCPSGYSYNSWFGLCFQGINWASPHRVTSSASYYIGYSATDENAITQYTGIDASDLRLGNIDPFARVSTMEDELGTLVYNIVNPSYILDGLNQNTGNLLTGITTNGDFLGFLGDFTNSMFTSLTLPAIFNDNLSDQIDWVKGQITQDLGTLNGLFYITGYDLSSGEWQQLFAEYMNSFKTTGNHDIYGHKWIDTTFSNLPSYDPSDPQRELSKANQWIRSEVLNTKYANSVWGHGITDPTFSYNDMKSLYDYYFAHRWMMPLFDYYTYVLAPYYDLQSTLQSYANSCDTNSFDLLECAIHTVVQLFNLDDTINTVINSLYSAILDVIELQLSSLQNIAVQIRDMEIYFHTISIRENIYNSIFNSLKNGFSEFISLAITSKKYQETTNASGQFFISMKDYVYSQMTSYLSNLDTSIISNKLVDEYLTWISGGNPTNLKEILANQTGWFTSFNDFVFYFDINNSRTTHANYAGYVDEKYGYETFIVSGQTARRYINPYYLASLNVGEDAWDIDTSFFLPVPREALQDFKIEIPEFTSEMLSQDNLVYYLDGYLNTKNNGGQTISLFRKSGTEYIFLRELTTLGQDTSITMPNVDTTPIYSQTSSTKAKLLTSTLNRFTQFKNQEIANLESSDGISTSTTTNTVNQLNGTSVGVTTGTMSFNYGKTVLMSTIPKETISVNNHLGSAQGHFNYTFDLENLGVGQHEFMFEYAYEIPEIFSVIRIRQHLQIEITSKISFETSASASGNGLNIQVKALDALGRPAIEVPIDVSVFRSHLTAKTNNLGIALIYWEPPYPAQYEVNVTTRDTRFYQRESVKFPIEDKLIGAFRNLIDTPQKLSNQIEEWTGLHIDSDLTSLLSNLLKNGVDTAAVYAMQPIHLLTGHLNRWVIPQADDNQPFRISDIGLALDTIPLLEVLKKIDNADVLPLDIEPVLNAFGILENKTLQVKLDIVDILKGLPVIGDLINDKGEFSYSILGFDLNLKIPDIPAFALPGGVTVEIKDGILQTSKFENPVYTAIKTLSNLRSLTDDGYFDVTIPDPLDAFDGNLDGKITLGTKDCWTDWLGNEWCVDLSLSANSPLSLVRPGVLAEFRIPDPLELLLPFDHTFNGKIDFEIPNPNKYFNLFGFGIDGQDVGGGVPSDEPYINILELLADPIGDKLNLKLPYLKVEETPLWVGEFGNNGLELVGVGENEGATMPVPVYVFNLFNVFLDKIKGAINSLIYDLIFPPLKQAITGFFSDYEDEALQFADRILSILSTEGSNIQVALSDTINVVKGVFTSSTITDSIGSAFNSLAVGIPLPTNQISEVLSFLDPINKVLDALGPIKDLLKFSMAGVTDILLQIVMDALEEFINSIIERFLGDGVATAIGLIENSVVSTINNIFNIIFSSADGTQEVVVEEKVSDDPIKGATEIIKQLSGQNVKLPNSAISNIFDQLNTAVDTVFNVLTQNNTWIAKLLVPLIAPIFGISDFIQNIVPSAAVVLSNLSSDNGDIQSRTSETKAFGFQLPNGIKLFFNALVYFDKLFSLDFIQKQVKKSGPIKIYDSGNDLNETQLIKFLRIKTETKTITEAIQSVYISFVGLIPKLSAAIGKSYLKNSDNPDNPSSFSQMHMNTTVFWEEMKAAFLGIISTIVKSIFKIVPSFLLLYTSFSTEQNQYSRVQYDTTYLINRLDSAKMKGKYARVIRTIATVANNTIGKSRTADGLLTQAYARKHTRLVISLLGFFLIDKFFLDLITKIIGLDKNIRELAGNIFTLWQRAIPTFFTSFGTNVVKIIANTFVRIFTGQLNDYIFAKIGDILKIVLVEIPKLITEIGPFLASASLYWAEDTKIWENGISYRNRILVFVLDKVIGAIGLALAYVAKTIYNFVQKTTGLSWLTKAFETKFKEKKKTVPFYESEGWRKLSQADLSHYLTSDWGTAYSMLQQSRFHDNIDGREKHQGRIQRGRFPAVELLEAWVVGVETAIGYFDGLFDTGFQNGMRILISNVYL